MSPSFNQSPVANLLSGLYNCNRENIAQSVGTELSQLQEVN